MFIGIGLGVNYLMGGVALPWYYSESFKINDVSPTMFADFVNNRLAINGEEVSLTSVLTCTRAHTTTAVATYHNSSGYIQLSAANTLRMDYNPTTLTRNGILVEKNSSNTIRRSENISYWTASKVTVALDGAVINPYGTTGAYKITEDSTAGEHYVSISTNAGGVVNSVHSIFVKASAGTPNVCVSAYNSTLGHYYSATFDPNTGDIVTNTGGGLFYLAKAIQYPNGWWRLVVMGSCSNTKSDSIFIRLANGTSTNYTGSGTSSVYLWGAQREDSIRSVMSYIPNETGVSTVTRNSDVITLDKSLWFSATQGTILTSFNVLSVGETTNRSILCFDDTTANEQLTIKLMDNASDSIGVDIVDGGVNQFDSDIYSFNTTGNQYTCVTYGLNNCASAVNESLGLLDVTATLPTVTTCRVGSSVSGEYLNGWIRDIVYLNQRVPDLEVLRLSSEMYYAE